MTWPSIISEKYHVPISCFRALFDRPSASVLCSVKVWFMVKGGAHSSMWIISSHQCFNAGISRAECLFSHEIITIESPKIWFKGCWKSEIMGFTNEDHQPSSKEKWRQTSGQGKRWQSNVQSKKQQQGEVKANQWARKDMTEQCTVKKAAARRSEGKPVGKERDDRAMYSFQSQYYTIHICWVQDDPGTVDYPKSNNNYNVIIKVLTYLSLPSSLVM